MFGRWPLVGLAFRDERLHRDRRARDVCHRAGRHALRLIVARRLDQDECLDDEFSMGLLLAAAGVLLLLPGMITDLLGLALLLPATRRRIVAAISRRATKRRLPRGPGVGVSSSASRGRAGRGRCGGRKIPADSRLADENAGRLSGKNYFFRFAGVGKCSRATPLLNPSRRPKASSASMHLGPSLATAAWTATWRLCISSSTAC